MARKNVLLSDAQWKRIEPLLPKLKVNRRGGRPWANNREVFVGILWVLKTGARWRDVPEPYPRGVTCWRRLKLWEDEGVWLDLWRVFLGQLDRRGQIDWSESFADASFAPAKKGGPTSERPSVEMVQSGWWWSTARVFLSEVSLPRPHQLKSRFSRPRSPRSKSRGRGRAGHDRNRPG